MGLTAKDLLREDFVRVSGDNSVSHLIGKLRKANQEGAVICDGSYCGIVTKKKLFKSHIDFSKLKVKHIVETCPTLSADDSIERVAELMFGVSSPILPVVDGDKILGVIHAIDLVVAMRKPYNLDSIKASDIASMNIITLNEKDTVGKAMHIMKEKAVRRIPIVNSAGELAGIVSLRDIVEKYLLQSFRGERQSSGRGIKTNNAFEPEKFRLLDTPIANDMTDVVRTALPSDNLRNVINTMSKYNIYDVVIAENNKPVGIITARDILRHVIKSRAETLNVQFAGLPKLDEIDSALVNRTVSESYSKIQRIAKINYMRVHVKTYHAKAGRVQYEVHIHLSAPPIVVNAKDSEWNILTAIQKTLKRLEREVLKAEGKK